VRLRGRVLAKGTREPLVGATVTVDAALVGETDDAGRFELDVPPGARNVQIVFPGYEPLADRVTVRPDAEGTQTFRLAPRQTGERYETVVVPPSDRAPRTSLRDEELTRTPGALGDPFRTIESLPGVSQVVWPLPIYAIRGANPGNTGFFLDGTRLPALFHFALGPSIIHPFFLQQIDFYPGGYPTRFGRYVSGIVDARTAAPKTDRLRASVDVRLFDAGGIVATPFDEGKGTIAVAGRYSYTGLLFSIFSPQYTLGYWDYQIRADHTLGPGRLTLFALGSSDTLGNKKEAPWRPGVGGPEATDPGTSGQPRAAIPWGADLQFHRLDLRWDGALGGGRLEVGTLVGIERSSTFLPQLFALPISARNRTLGPRLVYERGIADWLDVEVGADVELQRFSPHSERIGAAQLDLFRTRDVVTGGGFVDFVLRSKDRLVLTPGFRYELFAEGDVRRYEPSPRLHLRVRPAGEIWLKATAGRFAQMPSLAVAVPGFENFGLATFGPQTSWQGSVGVEAPVGAGWSLDATGFYQRLRLTDLRSIYTLDPQERDLLEMRDGESFGAELLLRRAASHRFWGWAAYTISWSYRLVGFGRVKSAADWDQRHILNLVAGYRLGRGYSVGSRFHLNTGRPYPVFNDRTKMVSEYRRLPTFYQLDLRFDKRFLFDRFILDVYFEVVNSTWTREVFDIRRNGRGELVETGFPLAFPSLGVHAEF
jgi:hypothetical protein